MTDCHPQNNRFDHFKNYVMKEIIDKEADMGAERKTFSASKYFP